MYTVHTLIKLETFNLTNCFTMELLPSKFVLLKVSYSPDSSVLQAKASWNELWKSLFLRRGEESTLIVPDKNIPTVTRIVHPKELNDRLLIFISHGKHESKVSVKWSDMKKALTILRRRQFRDQKLSSN